MAASTKRFKKYQELLEYISIAARPQLKTLCHNLHSELVQLITDIAYNLLYNRTLPIEIKHRAGLRQHKQSIRKLAVRPGSLAQKQKLLRQKGHLFLPELVKPVLDHLVYPATEDADNNELRTTTVSKGDSGTQ